MNLTILCPSCQRPLRVPDNLLGESVKCPSCEQTFVAPDHVEEPPNRSAAPPPEHYEDKRIASGRRDADEDYDEDYDEAPRRSRFRREKPGKVQAIAVMMLVGGILATLHAAILMITIYGLCWPGTYYSLVMGILAIKRASQLMGDRVPRQTPPSGIAIMQIINIVNCDAVNLTLGIISLVFLNDDEVKDFFRS